MSESTLPEGVEVVQVAEAGEGVECRTVPGFPGYAVGSDGSVWSCLPYPWRKNPEEIQPWRRLVPRRLKNGYYMTSFHKDGKAKPEYIHRAVLMVFAGPPRDGECAAHGDGDRSNNRLSNLRWTTRKGNEQDKKAHGTYNKRGHKVTDEQAVEIVDLYRTTDMTYRQLAEKYGTTIPSVCNMLKGKTYRHLSLDLSNLPSTKHRRGDNSVSPLVEQQVRDIRRRRAAGEKLKPLANEFGVDISAIWSICKMKSWQHLK